MPFHYQVLLFASLGFHVLDVLVVHYFVSASVDTAMGLSIILRSMIACAVWVPYMNRSRRVGQTFVRA